MRCKPVPVVDGGDHVATAQVFIDENNIATVVLLTPDLENEWTPGESLLAELVEFNAADSEIVDLKRLREL